MADEDYTPATRPPGDIPGGDRVRFEREGEHEQFLGGGGAQDIEASILNSTERNVELLGWKITSVTDLVGAMGSGSLQEITFQLENGSRTKIMTITGIGMEVEVR